MKPISILTTVALAVSFVSAAAIDGSDVSSPALEAQFPTVRNDLIDGDPNDCPSVILIFARGSSEPGNMGVSVGPALASPMEDLYDGMWVQGVGGPYTADVLPNLLPLGATQPSIDEAKRLYTMAHDKCPSSVVVAGGYSQGTAVVGVALTQLASEPDIQEQVAGVVLFGYTKNLENDGKIPDFPEEKTKAYCETGDVICHGILVVLPSHFLYLDDASIAAPIFLRGRINVATQSG